MRHKILVLFALLLAFSIYGCSKPDDIFHNYEGTYPEDIVSEDNCMPSFGRIYIDPAYYRAIDGKDYIAVNTFQGAFVKEDVMNSLSVGDDLRIDRDTTVKVDRLDFDPDWEDPYYPEGGNFTNGVMFHRKKGIITINKDYFFTHPLARYFADGSVQREFEAKADDWILRKIPGYAGDVESAETCDVYDSCKWVRVSEECKVIFFENESYSEPQSVMNILELLKGRAKNEDQKYFKATLSYSDGELLKINIDMTGQ